MDNERFLDEALGIDARIRYVGIYDNDKFYEKKRIGLKSLLDKQETIQSVQAAINRFERRKSLAPKIGNVIYAFAKYEKVNRITIPIGKDGLILVSTESDVNPIEIADKIVKKKSKYNF